MFFMETIFTEGIAQLSYLIGDDSEHIAAVVDPRADVEVYLALARKRQVAITHIFETHIHADFMSGSRELAARCPKAKLFLSGEGNSDYEFEHEGVSDGQEFEMGSSILRARFTPGHTPEHLSYELCDSRASDEPWGVLTGDSLFVDSAGRPDLLGRGQTKGLTQQLYETLYDYYLKLPDHVIIHPGHGAPPAPEHYFRLKKLNARGAKVIGGLPVVTGLTPDAFHRLSREPGTQIVDTRHMLAFGGGHIPTAINIGFRPELSIWAGQMLDPEDRMLLILEHDDQLDDVVRLFVRTGFVKFEGYLVGSMTAWASAGLPIVRLPQVHVRELKADSENGSQLRVLDVRSPEEFDQGHIPGADHLFVADMRRRIDGLDKEQPIATYCASGYRASLASSLMQSRGFKHVSNVPGSWEAWIQAGYPVETPSS